MKPLYNQDSKENYYLGYITVGKEVLLYVTKIKTFKDSHQSFYI